MKIGILNGFPDWNDQHESFLFVQWSWKFSRNSSDLSSSIFQNVCKITTEMRKLYSIVERKNDSFVISTMHIMKEWIIINTLNWNQPGPCMGILSFLLHHNSWIVRGNDLTDVSKISQTWKKMQKRSIDQEYLQIDYQRSLHYSREYICKKSSWDE